MGEFRTFNSTDSDGPRGVRVELLRPLTDEERDPEVGEMWRVRLPDGTETDAFADELQKDA